MDYQDTKTTTEEVEALGAVESALGAAVRALPVRFKSQFQSQLLATQYEVAELIDDLNDTVKNQGEVTFSEAPKPEEIYEGQ